MYIISILDGRVDSITIHESNQERIQDFWTEGQYISYK